MVEKARIHTKVQEPKQKCSNSCKQNIGFNSSGSTADMVLQLQRTAGNQAVQRLIKSRALQAKLKIGQPNDIYEQEADRVAEQVMRMPNVPLHTGGTRIQRKCPKCKNAKEDEKLQAEENSGKISNVSPNIEANISSMRGGGQPLPESVRAFFEPRFGHDFSQVRTYTGAKAVESARAMNAQAYTVGKDVVFGAGQYIPGTSKGNKLLAHELTHVVQQSGADSMRFGQDEDKRGLLTITSVIQREQNALSPIGISIGQVSDRLIQRDQEPKMPEKSTGEAAEKAKSKALEEAKSAALSELKEIELNWKEIRDPAVGFSDVTDWLIRGDMVIRLLRTHTELALDAIDKGDSALSKFMTSIVESDMVMYRFLSWHVAVYVNLLSLEPDLKDLISAFAADDRAFTGRAEAEEIVKLLTQLAGGYRKQAPKWLELVKILPAEVTKTSGHKITLTVTIAAHHDKSVSDLFANETEKFIQDQAALETLIGATNQFLDAAFKEGLVQAAEVLVEFYSVRGGKRGGPKASKAKGKGKKREKKRKSKKCSNAEIEQYNTEMHKFCNKERKCSMQVDTCESATAKVAAGNGCVRLRTELQQRCFSPGDPKYAGHMMQIAHASAALRECIKVMTIKCRK